MALRSSRLPRSGEEARGRVLGRFLDGLRFERESTVAVADGPFGESNPDPWTRKKLDLYFERPESPDPGSMLVAHGVALLAKCAEDLSALRRPELAPGPARYAAQAELMLDTAVGSALVREVQHRINALLKDGAIEEARYLSHFHHTLRNAVFSIRKRISSDDEAQAESLADQLTVIRAGREIPDLERLPVAQEQMPPGRSPGRARPGPALADAAREPVAAPSARSEGHAQLPASAAQTRILALALLVSSALWIAGLVPEALREQPPPVTPASLDPTGNLRQVEDRRPSLFAVVDGTAWRKMEESEREEWARRLVQKVQPLGYSGMLLRDDDDRPVARWISGRNVAFPLGLLEDAPPETDEGPVRTAESRPASETY